MRAHISKGLFFLLIALSLMLSACDMPGGGGGGGSTYDTGTRGLELEWLPASPPRCPSIIYHGDPADVEMRISNKGASTASGTVHLSGFDPNIFEGLSRQYSFSGLEGRSQLLPDGGVVDKGDSFSLRLPNEVDSLMDVNIQADLCYGYETKAQLSVCIDPVPGQDDNDACNEGVQGGISGGQGAPIAISDVAIESSKTRTTFVFTVSDSGSGKPYLGSNCRDIPYDKDESVRLSRVALPGGQTITCTPGIGEQIRLSGGRADITCRMNNQGDSAFTTIVQMDLDYNYKQTSSLKVCGKRG